MMRVVWSYVRSIKTGECVVHMTCQPSTSDREYNAFLAALITEGCKLISGSSKSRILDFSGATLVVPFLYLPSLHIALIADHKNAL